MILFNQEARQELKKGVDLLCDAVKTTLGPKGRNVVIEKPFSDPHITKDGVTVAKAVQSKIPVQEMGIMLVRQAASTTADVAGDGTTTSTILAQEMITQGLEAIDNGSNPMGLKKGMQKALEEAVHYIKEEAEDIDINSERIEQVATISANNDPELGRTISEAIKTVGKEGIVLVDQSKTAQTHVDYMNGITFDKGYLSEYFVTNPGKMLVELKEPLILFVDQNVKAIQSLAPIIEACNTNGVKVPLVIIADDIIEQALNMIIANKMKSGLEIVCIKAPSFGDNRKDTMKDMAVATGGTYISESNGITLEQLGNMPQQDILSHLGDCDKITVSKNSTTIVGGKGEGDELEIRVNSIKADLENTSVPQYKTQMKERIAKLTGGVAVIYVGAATEVEMKEKKDRVDDAVSATQAALEEGIVPGGGFMLSNISAGLENNCDKVITDEQLGYHFTSLSLRKPFHQIMLNAGYSPEAIDKEVDKHWDKNGIGFDALNERWVDLKAEGIIDPAKVTRVALENAVSVASTVLTTNVTINMDPEDKPKDVSGSMGPMMGMGGY